MLPLSYFFCYRTQIFLSFRILYFYLFKSPSQSIRIRFTYCLQSFIEILVIFLFKSSRSPRFSFLEVMLALLLVVCVVGDKLLERGLWSYLRLKVSYCFIMLTECHLCKALLGFTIFSFINGFNMSNISIRFYSIKLICFSLLFNRPLIYLSQPSIISSHLNIIYSFSFKIICITSQYLLLARFFNLQTQFLFICILSTALCIYCYEVFNVLSKVVRSQLSYYFIVQPCFWMDRTAWDLWMPLTTHYGQIRLLQQSRQMYIMVHSG